MLLIRSDPNPTITHKSDRNLRLLVQCDPNPIGYGSNQFWIVWSDARLPFSYLDLDPELYFGFIWIDRIVGSEPNPKVNRVLELIVPATWLVSNQMRSTERKWEGSYAWYANNSCASMAMWVSDPDRILVHTSANQQHLLPKWCRFPVSAARCRHWDINGKLLLSEGDLRLVKNFSTPLPLIIQSERTGDHDCGGIRTFAPLIANSF